MINREYIGQGQNDESSDMDSSYTSGADSPLLDPATLGKKNASARRPSSSSRLRRGSAAVGNISPIKLGDTSRREAQLLMQTLNKNHIVFKIQAFSKKHEKGGVALLADKLIELYRNLAQKEIALKSQYEDLSKQVANKVRGAIYLIISCRK